jgi:Type II CAAX prenyl endopeptidase Rce1-like
MSSLRYVVATAFVGGWVACGLAFHLSAIAYLLLGIPLTAAFQILVARQPLVALWVRRERRFGLDRRGWLVAVVLALAPLVSLVSDLQAHRWLEAAWSVAAVLGAVPGAFALTRLRRADGRALLACMATAGVIGVLWMAGAGVAVRLQGGGAAAVTLAHRLGTGIHHFLDFVPVVFVLEEVSFRGALDSYVHPDPTAKGLASAAFVSALWGLWHLPVAAGRGPMAVVVVSLLLVHTTVGIPLSVYFRRSGNLAVPGIVHAFIDGVRDMLLA